MIHRPDRVNSDLDDRLIKPNEARSATNLRMGASLNDTNLGITLVNGLKQLPYAIPAGNNVVIGTREDFETGWGYFALWNSNGDHGIWRTDGQSVEKVIAVVGFTQNMDVSIAIVDGKIYWTDNINQPRMCNIAKGIANLYPFPYQEWFFTQIKRQPGAQLKDPQNPSTTFQQLSTDYTPLTLSSESIGIQYNYYYIFDNEEESRLGPWTNPSWTSSLTLTILSEEFLFYLQANASIIKAVQFVYRLGNDGVVYGVKRVPIQNLVPVSNQGVGPTIANAYLQPRSAISSEITNARYDSVPLLSATNEIAQNRLNHGNYLIDYPPTTGITLTAFAFQRTFNNTNFLTQTADNFQTCRPSGIYKVGVEICDEWGRTESIIAPRAVQIPAWRVLITDVNTTQSPALVPTTYADDYVYNAYGISFAISGVLPSWAKYVRFMISKDQSVNYFHKTIVRLFYWYQDNLGTDIFIVNARPLNPNSDPMPDQVLSEVGDKLTYVRKGYAAEMISPVPFIFSSTEDQYIRVAEEFQQTNRSPRTILARSVEYRITKSTGNMFMFETTETDLSPASYNGGNSVDNPLTGFDSLFYTAEFGSKKKTADDIYYQTTNIILASQYAANGNRYTGFSYGDCYLSAFKKDFVPVLNSVSIILPTNQFKANVSARKFNQRSYNVNGCFFSMNPRNIYFQSWDSNIGQSNVVNENQRQTRLQNQFIFSDPLVQGTQINGLSKFNSVDNRQTPLENGPITALFTANARQGSPGVLLAIGRLGVSSFYVGATQLTNVDGSSNVASTTDYAVSQNPLLGQFGASKIRNICKTPLGTLYWWSEIVNDWIRYSQAGLDRLGATNSFMNDLRKNLAGNPSVFTTYDQVTNEAILIGQGEQAFVFSEQFNTLQPKRDYYDQNAITPERGMSLAQKNIFFLNGILYVMGPNEAVADNSFFGELKSPGLVIVSNVEPTSLKRWNSYNIFGPKPVITQLNSGGGEIPPVQSEIRQGWWIDRKNNYTAAIRMDENSVGGILNGKVMESRILITNFTFDPTDFDKLNYIEVKATRSPTQ